MGTITGKPLSLQPEFEVYESVNSVNSQKWRWRVMYYGKIIGSSSEGYTNKIDCIQNAEKLKDILNKVF